MKRNQLPYRALLAAILLLFSAVPAIAAEFLQDVHGFWDARGGMRTDSIDNQRDTSLLESRLQLALERYGDLTTLQLRGDLLYDDLNDEHDPDLETGEGAFDLREATLAFSPTDIVDVKLGRQILTWGTGDLLFINDLFPKDWQSFFTGRDVEYLKAPSDAVMVSLFPAFANIDIVYTPRFDSDRYIRGQRLSYYNPLLGGTAGRNAIIDPVLPDEWFDDDELTLRISKNIGGYEAALYLYDGFWKSPAGFDSTSGRATFPRLSVYGASLRGNMGPGIAHLETGYYDSRDDQSGRDALLPNSEWRLLGGYEQEVIRNVTLAGQYYLEVLQNYQAYENNSPAGMPLRDHYRQVLTLRLTWLLMNQNLTLSLFGYHSPTGADSYLRPNIKYKLTDAWQLTVGANLFFGEDDHTFFGQFEDNNNLYAGVRYSF
ncbi:MAG: hypothetical protein C0618_11260 [Desulfuromonas sp.]|nr:MAG: hypothetical protein C0618_11260 [Desulfuromonas sp.]